MTPYTKEIYEQPDGFHSKDGLYFQRKEDGSVDVINIEYRGEQMIETMRINLSHTVWASAVSSVSKLGEDFDRWRQAIDFHMEGSVIPMYGTGDGNQFNPA